jgi:hypothetical protein
LDERYAIGVGPTAELTLRVSIATLVRVLLPHPDSRESLLALEHKATLFSRDVERRLVVKAQPFGGAVRFLNLNKFQQIISQFHYDSERARSEGDFRIFIQPSDWGAVRKFCLRNFNQEQTPDLETDPARELAEEFEDALGIELQSEQYTVKPVRTIVENEPARTNNVHAFGLQTVRVYQVFEANILDPALARSMVVNSEGHHGQVLGQLALEDAQRGGPGRANAMFMAPLKELYDAYQAVPPDKWNKALAFKTTLLDSNVPAVIDGLDVPKYQISNGR